LKIKHIDPYFYSNFIQFSNQLSASNTRESQTWSNSQSPPNHHHHQQQQQQSSSLIPAPPTAYHPTGDLNAYDQFSFGFHPAFNFGYTGNGDFTTWTGVQAPLNNNGTRKSLYEEYYRDQQTKLETCLASLNLNSLPNTNTNPTSINNNNNNNNNCLNVDCIKLDDTSTSISSNSANNSINGQLPKIILNNQMNNKNWAGIVSSPNNNHNYNNNNNNNNFEQKRPQQQYHRQYQHQQLNQQQINNNGFKNNRFNNNNNSNLNQNRQNYMQSQTSKHNDMDMEQLEQQENSLMTKYQHQYNPKEFNLVPKGARFFVIKSYSEDDVHRSIKYNIWCSTEHGNRRLDQAFREREGKGPVYLFFSVNGSGHFCGMAEMISPVDYESKSHVWSQDKWKGKFDIKWIFIKDIPNSQLRNIRLENNENKPVTNSRDTQEVPFEKGKQVLKVFYHYRHTTSIFDDFEHYEKRLDEDHKKTSNPILDLSSTTTNTTSNDTNNNNLLVK
jgi:hypothetical protein